MITENPSIAFVVPAHNEQQHLGRCLDSIRRQDLPGGSSVETALILVDNQSTDQTREIAGRFGAKIIEVIPGNAGRARNSGAATVDSEFLAFVDADCVLPKSWLMKCLKHFDDSRVVAVGCGQAPAAQDAPWTERVWLNMIIPKSSEAWERVDWLPAFNLIIRKSHFDAVGGFDETLETCEDSDLSFRLAQRGELRRDHGSPVEHLGESRSLGEFFRREMWRSRGNFRSAIKRGSVLQELPSLFVPIGYLAMIVCCLMLLVAAFSIGGFWAGAFVVSTLFVVLLPMAIAFAKGERMFLPHASFLVAVYLMARGLGPALPARRVSRS